MTDDHRTRTDLPDDPPASAAPPAEDTQRDAPSTPATRAERRAAQRAAELADLARRSDSRVHRVPTHTAAIGQVAPAASPDTAPTTPQADARFAPSPSNLPAPLPAPSSVMSSARSAPSVASAPVMPTVPTTTPDPADDTPHAPSTDTAGEEPPSSAGPSTSGTAPHTTRRQIAHAARRVASLGRGNAARLLLLTVVTALAVEMIRASGPLLDHAFTSGVVTAALTALVTYAAPALAVTIVAARLPVNGRVVVGAVVALVVWRLGLQGLGIAAASGSWLGTARYGLGLGGAALAVATVVLVAGFASGTRPHPSTEPDGSHAGPPRPANGRMVAMGIGLGILGAAGVSLLHGTWDAYWRTDLLGWVAPVVLGGVAVVAAWLLRRDPATPGSRGLWVLGPYLALGVMVFGNPAFVASQTGLSLPAAGGAVAVTALVVGLLPLWGVAGTSTPAARALASTGRWVSLVLLPAFTAVLFLVPGRTQDVSSPLGWALLVCVVGLAATATDAVRHALTRPAHELGWARLAGASTAVGLGLILPLLVYQLDYDVPLPVPNATVPVAVAVVLAVAGLRRARGGPADLPEAAGTAAGAAADAAHAPAPGLRISLPVTAAVAALAAAGAVLVSTSATPVAVADREQRLTVLDWNLHYGVSATPSVDLDEVVAIVRDSGAQVVTLQEVSRGWVLGGGVDMASYLARETGLEVEFVGAADRQFGNAILWNPDVVTASDVARLALPLGAGPQNRSTVSATFTPVDGDTSWPDGVRVTSVHLQHREASTPTRLDQLDALFAAEPVAGPYLLAGDLNAEPGWEEIDLVESHGLVSGQDDVGNPGDLTSPADAPAYRIDWVFGAGLEFQRVTVLDVAWSDHRPLVAVVRPSGTEQE
ncbi:endonuclease/exonuclease/phosphatase family protein [Oerskovia enterophila]|uniref:endonuclease/exonuclease/phosphatase family protein n=1 Tax=Oerskovia enterophila TaxID=43678 RepID=UPI003830F12F